MRLVNLAVCILFSSLLLSSYRQHSSTPHYPSSTYYSSYFHMPPIFLLFDWFRMLLVTIYRRIAFLHGSEHAVSSQMILWFPLTMRYSTCVTCFRPQKKREMTPVCALIMLWIVLSVTTTLELIWGWFADEAISFVKRIVHDLYGDGATVSKYIFIISSHHLEYSLIKVLFLQLF